MRALHAPPQARPTPPHHNPPDRIPPQLRSAWVRDVTACSRELSSHVATALTTTTASPPAVTSAVTAGAARSELDGRTGR